MKIRQNKMIGYLAVTAGVGCAVSVAEGAIVVVDLSGLSTTLGNKTIPGSDGTADFQFVTSSNYGELRLIGSTRFYSDVSGNINAPSLARGYSSSASANFPLDKDNYANWNFQGDTGGGFAVGVNWVAFKDSAGKFGWMSFTLNSLGKNNTNPIGSFGHFAFDPASTSPATAITLQAAAAAVPEPSGLVLLALGATGLAARRQRRKAA